MFRVQNNVPDVYINESRDFQLFARLYDLVFQSSRFSIDSLEQVSDTMRCNDALLPLIATKVGFFTDLNLTSRADRLILSAFPYIISYKGSFRGIELVANVFERIMNTNVTVIQDELDKSHVTISFEQYTPDLSLLYPLLEYIRPTGMFIDYTVRTDLDVSTDTYTSYDEVERLLFNLDNEVAQTHTTIISNNNQNVAMSSPSIGFTQITQDRSMYTEINELSTSDNLILTDADNRILTVEE